MQSDTFIQNVKKYCEAKGVKPTVACEESGAGRNLLGQLKSRGTVPSVDRVQLLAQYLGCTTSDLLGEKKQPAPERDELQDRIEELNRQEREEVLRFLDYLRAKREMP